MERIQNLKKMIRPHVILFAFTPCLAFGQLTIGSAGGTLNSATDRLEYNIGEPVVGTVGNATSTFTQGFEQPWADVGTGVPTLPPEAAIRVFPNPTRHDLNILIPENAHHAYSMVDAAGKLILNGAITELLTTLDVTPLASGNYSLIVSDTANRTKQSFRIIINH
ncbi:MAG: T9SS type A sorting domain-containing protein [Flavobacteriales bacterium]